VKWVKSQVVNGGLVDEVFMIILTIIWLIVPNNFILPFIDSNKEISSWKKTVRSRMDGEVAVYASLQRA